MKRTVILAFIFVSAILFSPVLMIASPIKTPTYPPRPDNKIMAWLYDEYLGHYKEKGVHNPLWDQKVINALCRLTLNKAGSRITCRAIDETKLFNEFDHLINNLNCTDPLVFFGYSYMAGEVKAFEPQELKKLHAKNVRMMASSDFSDYLRYLILHKRSRWYIKYWHNKNAHGYAIRKKHVMESLDGLGKLLKNSKNPDWLFSQSALSYYYLFKNVIESSDAAYERIQKFFNECRPSKAGQLYLKGEHLSSKAWKYRGHGLARTVSNTDFNLFKKYLKESEGAFRESYKLRPTYYYVPLEMLTVGLGLSFSKEEFNLWFDRTIKIKPNKLAPYSAKLMFLLPRWHGSKKATLDFARETLLKAGKDKKLTRLAWIIEKSHYYLSSRSGWPSENLRYWKDQHVWNDFASFYETVIKQKTANVNLVKSYHLTHSIMCQKFDIARKLFEDLGPDIEQEPFTRYGMDVFDSHAKVFLND